MRRTHKAQYAAKLLASKNFVLLTDKEGVISLQGVDPTTIGDLMMLESQRAELANFQEGLSLLIKKHDKALASLYQPTKKRRT